MYLILIFGKKSEGYKNLGESEIFILILKSLKGAKSMRKCDEEKIKVVIKADGDYEKVGVDFKINIYKTPPRA